MDFWNNLGNFPSGVSGYLYHSLAFTIAFNALYNTEFLAPWWQYCSNEPRRIWFLSYRRWGPSFNLCRIWILLAPSSAHQGSREEQGCTGSGGHLTKHSTCNVGACGQKAAAIHHAKGHLSDRLLDLRQPLCDLSQALALEGQAGDMGSHKYTLKLSKVRHTGQEVKSSWRTVRRFCF